MSSSSHPHNHHNAVELRIGSLGSSPKAVIYPPFLYPVLSVLNVPSLPVVAEGLSLPMSKVGSAVCRRSAGMCLGAADAWCWASADGENGLALGMEIVCNTIYRVGRFCL